MFNFLEFRMCRVRSALLPKITFRSECANCAFVTNGTFLKNRKRILFILLLHSLDAHFHFRVRFPRIIPTRRGRYDNVLEFDSFSHGDFIKITYMQHGCALNTPNNQMNCEILYFTFEPEPSSRSKLLKCLLMQAALPCERDAVHKIHIHLNSIRCNAHKSR